MATHKEDFSLKQVHDRYIVAFKAADQHLKDSIQYLQKSDDLGDAYMVEVLEGSRIYLFKEAQDAVSELL